MSFYLTRDQREAELIKKICLFWNDHFPINKIISPYELKENKISEKEYKNLKINLKPGQQIKIKDLLEKLSKLDYERNKTANQEKTFAVRGDIIDIYHGYPVRLEFDKDKIEKIYQFKLDTNLPRRQAGKKLRDLSELIVYPDKISENAFIVEEKDLQLQFMSPKFYNLRFRELETDLSGFLKIKFLTKDSPKLRKIFPAAEYLNQPKDKVKLESFILLSENLIFLTDDNIFGAPILEEKTELDEDFIANLEPGDYVVHIDHGIAKYAGPYEDENGKKFFKLEYAKKDKLYVPWDKADRIDKYIGSPNPKLHRLSEESWLNIVSKIKEHTQKTAEEILHIYAQRELAEAHTMKECPPEEELAHSFEYDLTPDQERSIEEIYKDLDRKRPMDRLVCGDVGFGKTEVAIRAAFRAVLNGYQVAVLCPTTILTQQHFDTFHDRLDQFGVNIDLLSRFRTGKQQKEAIAKLKEGKVDIIIGTHRLLSKDIKFNNLGLIIIDEEQKFGVRHKEKLKELRSNAHILTMTATPIPRTLNLALSGLRNISAIRTAPPGRMAIETLIEQDDDRIVKNALETELKRKGQAYYLYNKVETIGFAAKRIQKLIPSARIGIAHGQQDAKTLAKVMSQFDNHEIDILVCSTIIENGLDITNANTLIVQNAPNFGLAQLYQIRGRIGRSHQQAYAYFLYNQEKLTDEARKRLKALKEASAIGSGYELAMKDLEQRGVGAILGKNQHGHAQAVGLNLYLRLLNQSVKELKEGTN
ncbi:MAG: DEAD/DEAH box helicase [Patescibacteria group bacterium]|nr:DEAD/DEAH box helicase [Patescibacteria group bacterium]